ncbi:MAG: DUF1573 domain-containing protein [Thermodesulfobacteriota bacterium]|nr:DUF1573 domain-containing protein [Thermodesulfobacteriota bacterium]
MNNFVKISFLYTLGLIFFISFSCCAGQAESAGENTSAKGIQSAAKNESAEKIQSKEKTITDNKTAPSIFFQENTYKFKNAVEGKELVHSFMVKNKGNAPLLIQNVRTG